MRSLPLDLTMRDLAARARSRSAIREIQFTVISGDACQLHEFADAQRGLRGKVRQLQGSAKTLFHGWIRRLTILSKAARFSVLLTSASRFFRARSWILSQSKSSPRLRCEGHVEIASTVPRSASVFAVVADHESIPSLVDLIKVDFGEHDVPFKPMLVATAAKLCREPAEVAIRGIAIVIRTDLGIRHTFATAG